MRMLGMRPYIDASHPDHAEALARCERHDWSPIHLDPNELLRIYIKECLSCGKKRRFPARLAEWIVNR